MTMHLQTSDLGASYAGILRYVREHGHDVAPRGLKTKEVLNASIVLTDPTKALAVKCGRKLSVPVASAEALQLVGGFSDPAAMIQVSPHFAQFLDGGVFHAPYGPRTAPQMQKALDRLVKDPSTRQAVVQVWDPTQDLHTDNTRDYPCTTQLQFMIRSGRLDLHTTMRANDAWRGFPYDVFQFTQLQCAMANALLIEPGTYYHHASSFHLYEQNLEQVDALEEGESPVISGVGDAGGLRAYDWSTVQDRARAMFYGQEDVIFSEGEGRMYDALRRRGVTGQW